MSESVGGAAGLGASRVAREWFLVRPRRGLALGVTLLGLFGLIALAIPMQPLRVDCAWSEAMHDLAAPWLEHVALVFNALGRGLGWALTLAGVTVVLLLQRRLAALVVFGVAEAGSTFSSGLFKALVGRPRPPDGLVHPVGSSFPSGHASYAAVTCIALVLLFTRAGRRRGWWALAALGMAGMDWSRTYLQVHWLSDVIGGTLLGSGIALVTFAAGELLTGARQGGVRGSAAR
jgi:membrane-associated phospholipid phosphatase